MRERCTWCRPMTSLYLSVSADVLYNAAFLLLMFCRQVEHERASNRNNKGTVETSFKDLLG